MTQQPWGQPPLQRPVAGGQPWSQPQPGWGTPSRPAPFPGHPPSYGAPQAPYQGQPGSYYPPPQRPGGSPVKLLLLGLVAVIAVGFFFLSLMNYLNGPDEQVAPGPEPVPSPTVGETSAPPTGVPEPDLDPPELPIPQTWDEVDRWLIDNAIYAQSVQVPTNCTLSRLDVETVSTAVLQEHLNTLTGCLMMVWQEPMERAGFVMPRPPITVYTEPITTACGTIEGINASYCPGDQRMYYSASIHEVFRRNNPEVIGNAFLPDLIMGHEFGHAIQARSGILAAEILAGRQVKTESEELELQRRTEVQADCLAGVFLNAVAQASQMTGAERDGIAEMAAAIGDDSLTGKPGIEGNHGHGVNRRYWAETGLASSQAGVCNTWVAPADRVR